jgi:glycosyltransferase involved in cell wall biosynthesis
MDSKELKTVLSICIPTYNRCSSLENLLNQIYELNKQINTKIQICISDNHSSDDTAAIIEKWQPLIGFISIRQKLNIGAAQNFQAVASLASSPWVLLMGDDDLIDINGLFKLILKLENLNKNTWILADIDNQNGTTLLEDFPEGHWKIYSFKRYLLNKSLLDSLGFMSMHVIPLESIKKFIGLKKQQIYGWPHLALLFYELKNIEIYVHKVCIVKRGGDCTEVTQTWRPNDWLILMMQKTKLCCSFENKNSFYFTSLAIKEYFKWPFLRQVFQCKALNIENEELIKQVNNYINDTKIYDFAKLIIKIYIFLIFLIPSNILRLVRNYKNLKITKISKYEEKNKLTDGVDRGL